MLLRLMTGFLALLVIVSSTYADSREKSGMGFTYIEKMENAGSKSGGVRGVLLFNGQHISPAVGAIKTPIGSFHYVESNLPWKPQGWFPMEDIVAPNTPEPVTDEMLNQGSYIGALRTNTPANWCYLASSDSWVDPRQLSRQDSRSALSYDANGNAKTLTETSNCLLKPERGPCKAIFEAYYFDQQSRSCKPFLWGGCQGVVPFKNIEECNSQCSPKNK